MAIQLKLQVSSYFRLNAYGYSDVQLDKELLAEGCLRKHEAKSVPNGKLLGGGKFLSGSCGNSEIQRSLPSRGEMKKVLVPYCNWCYKPRSMGGPIPNPTGSKLATNGDPPVDKPEFVYVCLATFGMGVDLLRKEKWQLSLFLMRGVEGKTRDFYRASRHLEGLLVSHSLDRTISGCSTYGALIGIGLRSGLCLPFWIISVWVAFERSWLPQFDLHSLMDSISKGRSIVASHVPPSLWLLWALLKAEQFRNRPLWHVELIELVTSHGDLRFGERWSDRLVETKTSSERHENPGDPLATFEEDAAWWRMARSKKVRILHFGILNCFLVATCTDQNSRSATHQLLGVEIEDDILQHIVRVDGMIALPITGLLQVLLSITAVAMPLTILAQDGPSVYPRSLDQARGPWPVNAGCIYMNFWKKKRLH